GVLTTIDLEGGAVLGDLHTDVRAQPTLPRTDLLFVVDDGPAMTPYLGLVDDLVARFFDFQQAGNGHFRWGVTTTSRTATGGCAGSGADGRLLPFDGSGPRWLDSGAGEPLSAFEGLFDLPA